MFRFLSEPSFWHRSNNEVFVVFWQIFVGHGSGLFWVWFHSPLWVYNKLIPSIVYQVYSMLMWSFYFQTRTCQSNSIYVPDKSIQNPMLLRNVWNPFKNLTFLHRQCLTLNRKSTQTEDSLWNIFKQYYPKENKTWKFP